MAGYSGTPLWKKLGLAEGKTFAILGAPEGYARVLSPPDGARAVAHPKGRPQVVQLFVTRAAELGEKLPGLVAALPDDGALWISWPKGKAQARVPTDLDEGVVRGLGLDAGLVDVKVCAVDEVWSGLKFVFRLVDREKPRASKAGS